MQPHSHTNHAAGVARFELGQAVITPGAEAALEIAGQTATEFLRRHVSGDWGELSDETSQKTSIHLSRDPGC